MLSENEIPTEYKLKPATPNPFNPVTTISYDLPKNSHVRLVIYDILGREIRKLVDGYKEKGSHSAHFDGTNLSSGVYIILFEAGDYTRSSKIMLVK